MDMAAVKKAFSATIRRRKPKPAPVETVPEEQPLNHGNDKKEKKPREQHEVGEMTKTSLQKRRLKADSNPVHKKIKKVQVDVAAMNPKADAMENALIVRAKEEQQLIMRHAKRTIAVGATELPSVESAVKKGVKDSCALVIDFVSPETKHIGKLCKVYWDGENQWFYARILYYDSQHDKYFVSAILSLTCCGISYPWFPICCRFTTWRTALRNGFL